MRKYPVMNLERISKISSVTSRIAALQPSLIEKTINQEQEWRHI